MPPRDVIKEVLKLLCRRKKSPKNNTISWSLKQEYRPTGSTAPLARAVASSSPLKLSPSPPKGSPNKRFKVTLKHSKTRGEKYASQLKWLASRQGDEFYNAGDDDEKSDEEDEWV